VWESDGSAIVSDDMRDRVESSSVSENFAELEFSFVSIDFVEDEASLHVVKHSKTLSCLVKGQNIIVANRIVWITSDLVIDFDVSGLVLDDEHDLAVIQGIFKTAAEHHHYWNALS